MTARDQKHEQCAARLPAICHLLTQSLERCKGVKKLLVRTGSIIKLLNYPGQLMLDELRDFFPARAISITHCEEVTLLDGWHQHVGILTVVLVRTARSNSVCELPQHIHQFRLAVDRARPWFLPESLFNP